MKIFDSQVNWGRNVFGPNSDIETYIANAQNMGICKVIIIPTGTHELILPDGSVEKSCLWFYRDGRITYKTTTQSLDGKLYEEINPSNPYRRMNGETLALVRRLNSQYRQMKFYFSPKVHPKLDTKEEVERLIRNEEVVAFKITTLSSYASASDMPDWLVSLSHSYGLPIMVHTDYIDENDTTVSPEMQSIMRQSHPLKWIEWAKARNVRMFLAHGLRLDPKSCAAVNNSDNFIVGLGPDLLLQTEQSRLVTKTSDYLSVLFGLLDEDKISFNTDYRWNVKNRNDWNNLDWKTPARISQFATRYGLKDDFLKKIFSENSERFFKN